MGNLFASETAPNPDLLEYIIYPADACSLGRFEIALAGQMDPRLLYFMSREQYLFELRQFDKRLSVGDSDCCAVCCCIRGVVAQTQSDLQVLAMEASMRSTPLQFSVQARYSRGGKGRKWKGWLIRVLLPPGTTARYEADKRSGRAPTRLVLVAPPANGNALPMRMSMPQPMYGAVNAAPEGGQPIAAAMAGNMQMPMPMPGPGYAAGMPNASLQKGSQYLPLPSAPGGEHDVSLAPPPPYSRFEEPVAPGGSAPSQPPPVQKI